MIFCILVKLWYLKCSNKSKFPTKIRRKCFGLVLTTQGTIISIEVTVYDKKLQSRIAKLQCICFTRRSFLLNFNTFNLIQTECIQIIFNIFKKLQQILQQIIKLLNIKTDSCFFSLYCFMNFFFQLDIIF